MKRKQQFNGVWLLRKNFTFEAAHKLPNHDGKCARLHGHSWKLSVYVIGHKLLGSKDAYAGMVADYGWIKRKVQPLIDERLDHYYLNQSLKMRHPTSENVAQYIYRWLKERIPEILFAVEIQETCTSACRYSEGGPMPVLTKEMLDE